MSDNMDEASKLVSELQTRLAELDHKVWQYRRDMAAEFTKYAEGVLRDVPKDVSETVNRAITESIKGYKSLYPGATNTIESCATGTDFLANGAGNDRSTSYTENSTHPSSYRMQESDTEEGPRSPHEREKEFQGLFTPSYLPLLDSTSSNERRSSYSPQTTPPLDKGKEKEMNILQVDASTDTRSLAPSPELRRPPTPKRRNTDDVSIASDYSDSHARRSALRRSSSSSKGLSPRRVRFDVAGEEVLPTASPHPDQSIVTTDIPPSTVGLESDDEAGSEQVEDIDAPPPKRISSSQALRALSRGPFEDDGTKWTTVSAPPDGSASVATANGLSQESSSEDLQTTNGFTRPRPVEARSALDVPESSGGSSYNTSTTDKNASGEEEADTFSDDEMLDMPPLRTMRGLASMLSPSSPPNIAQNKSPTASTRSPSKPWLGLESLETGGEGDGDGDMKFLEEDHDELFHFDDDNIGKRSPPEEQEDSESDSPVSPLAQTEPVSLSKYSSSPAREIAKPSAPRSTIVASKGVVGSYKGHPFSMPIVSDEIHAKAASLGDVNLFVGSVDGRSGMDESDVQSFRASGGVGSFSGAPRSMTERMMLDELLESEEAKQK